MEEQMTWEERLRKLESWVAVVGTALFAGASLCLMLYAEVTGKAWMQITRLHFLTIIGVPAAAIASLGLVLLLRTVAGNIEAKFLGLEFRGAAGPIIMWILCFLSITLAMAKTWTLEYQPEKQNYESSTQK